MKKILYFNPDQNRRSEVRFLADLANINCVMSRTLEELLNWLRSAPLLDFEFDFILLGSLSGIEAGSPVYLELLKLPQLRIMLTADHISEIPLGLKERVIQWQPDGLLSCLEHHRK